MSIDARDGDDGLVAAQVLDRIPSWIDQQAKGPESQDDLASTHRPALHGIPELRGRDESWLGPWLRARLRGTRLLMRAYVGTVDQRGLQWFLPEDVIPRDLLPHFVRGWLTR